MRVQKAVSLLQESVKAGGSSSKKDNNNGSKRIYAMDNASILLPRHSLAAPVTPAAAVLCIQRSDVLVNTAAPCTLSVGSHTRTKMHGPRHIRPLSELEGLYRIRRLLGRGSYGIVVEVVHRITEERKAAKFIFRKESQQRAHKKKEGDCGGTVATRVTTTTIVNPNPATGPSTARALGVDAVPQGLPDGLIKEIVIAITVDHPNLVSASDVFVHDTAELHQHLRLYAPRLICAVSHDTRQVVEEGGGTQQGHGINARKVPEKTWRRSSLSGVNDSAVALDERSPKTVAGFLQQCPGVRSVAPDPRMSDNGTSTSAGRVLDEVRLLLREGKIECVLVMEFLSGGDLFTLVSRNPLDEARAASYMLDLFLALEHLHTRRIVHRDVKLENIVLDSNNKAHLVDYGFCEKLQRLGENGADADGNTCWGNDKLLSEFCGSHHYVAPEMVRAAVQLKQQMRSTAPKDGTHFECIRLPPITPLPEVSLKGTSNTIRTPLGQNSKGGGKCSGKSDRDLQPLLMSRGVGYDTSADIWSAGVAMFVLLHSAFPFHDDRRGKLLKMIMTSQQHIRPSPLLSSEAKDLLRQLLTRDVRHRLTATEALQHPWFKKATVRKRRELV